MESADIYRRLTRVFHDIFDDESIALTPEMTAEDIAEWDSLTHIRLVISVEKEFDVKFSAAEVGVLKNVGEFVALVQRKI